MKNKILIISLALVILVSTGCGCKKKDKKKPVNNSTIKYNTAKDVIKDQEIDGIKMTNTSLATDKGVSTLVTEVTNPTDKDYKLNQYWIIVKDKDNKIIVKLSGYVGEVIKAGSSRTLTIETVEDLSKAKSISYQVSK